MSVSHLYHIFTWLPLRLHILLNFRLPGLSRKILLKTGICRTNRPMA